MEDWRGNILPRNLNFRSSHNLNARRGPQVQTKIFHFRIHTVVLLSCQNYIIMLL